MNNNKKNKSKHHKKQYQVLVKVYQKDQKNDFI